MDGADDDEGTNAPAAETAVDRARDDAQMTVYGIDDLVKAALAINDDKDGRLEEVLKAASEKLVALSVALDSVNWPRGQHAQ